MNEYKGVYEFLEALKNSGHNQSFKITIAGYFTSEEYYQKVRTFESQSVLIKNDFVSEENLLELFKKSKVILFPYNPISILSSGALMSSLMAPAFLVGPHTAAFADMAEEKVVYTFSDYEQLIGMLEKLISEEELLPATIQIRKDFISHNTWPVFISKVNTLLHGLWS
jgi:glycosyltransferase involved in cell wall biosynthesis